MTMEALPTGRPGRLLALGLTIVALSVVHLAVVTPLIEWHHERTEALTRRSALAAKMEDIAASLPGLRQQDAAAVARKTAGPLLLEGDTDAMASASLQERLQAMFAQTGVQLSSVETMPGEAAGPYRRIWLRMAFNASWPALLMLLKELHLATPVLLVDELQVQAALHRIGTSPGTFDVSCAVFAFRAGPTQVSLR